MKSEDKHSKDLNNRKNYLDNHYEKMNHENKKWEKYQHNNLLSPESGSLKQNNFSYVRGHFPKMYNNPSNYHYPTQNTDSYIPKPHFDFQGIDYLIYFKINVFLIHFFLLLSSKKILEFN